MKANFLCSDNIFNLGPKEFLVNKQQQQQNNTVEKIEFNRSSNRKRIFNFMGVTINLVCEFQCLSSPHGEKELII